MDLGSELGGRYAAQLQPPSVYRQRRKKLAEMIGQGTIVLWGAGDERGYGDVGTFRQDPVFFYLTGVELANAVLAIRPHEDGELLFLPPRRPALERWTGPRWGPGEEAAAALGFTQVLSTEPSEEIVDARRCPVPGFEGRLLGWLVEPGAPLWTVYPALPLASELGPTHRLVARLRERVSSFEVRDISQMVDQLRMVKDEGEIGLLRQAVAATAEGHRAAAGTVAAGVPERAVEGAVEQAFLRCQAEGVAFPSIVGSGVRGTILHYDNNAGVCADGELVVVDIGARFGYYCGDLTRTYPVGGSFSERQRALYNAVLQAHTAVAAAIRPGVTIFELRKIAYSVLEDSELRCANGERLGQCFIHGLGHFLGLEAHDPGGDHQTLQPGMVITNEPGIYLQDEGVGIRIEDDFLVTEQGCENLSECLPRAAEDIEAAMQTQSGVE